MNYLVSDLLKIHTPHHTQIQRQITDYFARCGYESRTEKRFGGTERAGMRPKGIPSIPEGMCLPKGGAIRSGSRWTIARSG